MAQTMSEGRYTLAKRELMAIEVACDHLLKCEAGELWITTQGPRDIVIGPGESYRAQGRDAVVVSALRPSVLAVTHPTRCAAARKEGAEWVLARLLRWRVGPLAEEPATRIG